MYKKYYNKRLTISSSLINIILVFVMIYFPSSFYSRSMSGTFSIMVLLLLPTIVLIYQVNKIKIKIEVLLLLLLLITCSGLTLLINNDNVYNYLIFWAGLLIAFLNFLVIKIKEFIVTFNKIMAFLSTFSLVTYFLLLIIPSFYNLFPKVTNDVGLTMTNVIFAVVHESSYINYNFGLFWEPGAYQTFINLALFFQLFVLKEYKLKRIILFIITIFTTFSTTAYIACLFLLITFFLLNRNYLKEQIIKQRKLFFIVTVGLIVATGVFTSLSSNVYFKVFGKLAAIFNDDLKLNSSYTSAVSRTDAIEVPLLAVIEEPIFGVGFSKLTDYAFELGSGFLTATPLNWFGLFGLPIGIIVNITFWRWTKALTGGLLLKISIYAFLIMIIISENYISNPFYLLLIFYSFDAELLKSKNSIDLKMKHTC